MMSVESPSLPNVVKLLTVEEALDLLRISRTTLHQLIRSGQLPAVKFGRRTLFRATAIEGLIESHESKPTPPRLK